MVADLGATPPQIAHALGVSLSTVYRWLADEHAPQAARLSLFWLTSWGSSVLNSELHNRALVYAGLAQAMERELWAMRAQIADMGKLGDFGSANDPGPHITQRYGLDDTKTSQVDHGQARVLTTTQGTGIDVWKARTLTG